MSDINKLELEVDETSPLFSSSDIEALLKLADRLNDELAYTTKDIMRYLQLPYSKARSLMDDAGISIVKSKSPCIYGKVIKEYLQNEYLPTLNNELYKKLLHEKTQYIDELEKSGLSARELLEEHAYEYTVWSNIVYWVEEYDIEDVDVLKALLASESPLKDIQDTYESQDHEWFSDTENAIVFCGRAKINP